MHEKREERGAEERGGGEIRKLTHLVGNPLGRSIGTLKVAGGEFGAVSIDTPINKYR